MTQSHAPRETFTLPSEMKTALGSSMPQQLNQLNGGAFTYPMSQATS